MNAQQVLHVLHPTPLASSDCIDIVEVRMMHLGRGLRKERAGEMVLEALAAGGKRVRARLALAVGEALGGSREAMVDWAAACELLHQATLVHDDIQDGDRVRRGHSTVWARHGVPQAINCGDLLLMLPYLSIESIDTSDALKWRLSRLLARAAEATVRGQSLELDLLQTESLTWEDWTRAALGKSGALLALPVEGATLLAGLESRTASRFGDVFARLGVLFQLQDDLVDLSDRKGRKQRGSDLAEGKVSALVVEHLRRRPDHRDWLLELLRTPREATAQADIDEAINRFFEAGTVNAVRAHGAQLAEVALSDGSLRAVPELRAVALELANWMQRSMREVEPALSIVPPST